MDRFEGIKIFVRVVESGSFSAVAREPLSKTQPQFGKGRIKKLSARKARRWLWTMRAIMKGAERVVREIANPTLSIYVASKSAVNGLTRGADTGSRSGKPGCDTSPAPRRPPVM
jgi:hypothetical protein